MRPNPHYCRSSLSASDWDFIARSLTGDAANDSALRNLMCDDPESLNLILDRGELLRAVLELPGALSISPELYFYVLLRHGMKDAGINDREVTDYVAGVMADVARGNPFALRGEPPVDFTYHVDFLRVLEDAAPRDRFHLQVHCGNQFLILTGLFPDFLNRRHARRGAPPLDYYEGVARSAFRDAGDHPLAEEFGIGEVYRQLSDGFGAARRILNRVTAEYLFLGS